MQELEKILKEIDEIKVGFDTECRSECDLYDWSCGACVGECDEYIKERAKDIIRKHMNDGWIPVEKALPPEPPEYVDDEDDLEQYIVMIDGAERPTTLRYAGDGTWWEDGTYYHVIAWRPMPEVYHPVDKTERSEGE